MNSPFKSLSLAMAKGFFREKTTLFFTFVFPLMFLVVFELLFSDSGTDRIKLGSVGDGPVVAALRETGAVEVERYDTLDAGLAEVRDGDLPGLVEVTGDRVVLHFAAGDQAQAGTVRGLVQGVTQELNVAASGRPPKFAFAATQVEDSSLKAIQYLTPGILSWGIAISAVFGAALPLVSWRRK